MKNILQEWFLTDFHPKNRPGNLKIKSRPKKEHPTSHLVHIRQTFLPLTADVFYGHL